MKMLAVCITLLLLFPFCVSAQSSMLHLEKNNVAIGFSYWPTDDWGEIAGTLYYGILPELTASLRGTVRYLDQEPEYYSLGMEIQPVYGFRTGFNVRSFPASGWIGYFLSGTYGQRKGKFTWLKEDVYGQNAVILKAQGVDISAGIMNKLPTKTVGVILLFGMGTSAWEAKATTAFYIYSVDSRNNCVLGGVEFTIGNLVVLGLVYQYFDPAVDNYVISALFHF